MAKEEKRFCFKRRSSSGTQSGNMVNGAIVHTSKNTLILTTLLPQVKNLFLKMLLLHTIFIHINIIPILQNIYQVRTEYNSEHIV